MKNRLSHLLLIAVLSFLASSHTQVASLDSGIVLPIAGKMSTPIESVVIPSKYVTAAGDFLLPVKIILTDGSKYSISLTVKQGAGYIQLPANLSGEYRLEISIGDFYVEKKLLL